MKVYTAEEYYNMQRALLPEDRANLSSEQHVKLSILYELMSILPKKTIEQYSRRLEHDRTHFANANQTGHQLWYPKKIQKCYVWQNMVEAEK